MFCFGILDALQGIVPSVKVQTGCFQALGADGVRAMEEVIRYAKELDYYVLMDTMRGDMISGISSATSAVLTACMIAGGALVGSTLFRLLTGGALL